MTDLPRTKTYYVNIYRGVAGACGSAYETRAMADQMSRSGGRIACKRVEVAPGDGLDNGECDEPAQTRET